MPIYLCRKGHKHRSQDGAVNCGYCKRNARKAIESRPTVRRKPPVQQRKGVICPCCDGVGRLPDIHNGGTKRCEHCKGVGRLSPVA
jgi:hypothetical protein